MDWTLKIHEDLKGIQERLPYLKEQSRHVA